MVMLPTISPAVLAFAFALLLLVAPGLANDESSGTAERGRRGVLAVAHGGEVLVSSDADRLFKPASVQKLLVAAALLGELGPEHRIVTEVRAAAPPREGVLAGDLVMRGAGDPSVTRRFHAQNPERPLQELAAQLLKVGVRRVEGDLVVDTAAVPGWRYPPSRSASEVAVSLGTPVSALSVDGNTVNVRLAAGERLGVPAVIEGPDGLIIRNRSTTVGEHREGRGSIEFLPIWGSDEIVVRGEYPISEGPIRVNLSHPNPDLQALRVVRAELEAAGIAITGGTRVEDGAATRAGVVLAFMQSPPLADLLVPVLTRSDNWLADMLLRQLGLATAGEGRLDLSLDAMAAWLEEEVGVERDSFELEDGSGLGLRNVVTPRTVVAVIAWSYDQPWRASLFSALPGSRTGTLASWPPMPSVRAKTGTLEDTVALAGISRRGRQPVFFAYLQERDSSSRGAQRRRVAAWLSTLAPARAVATPEED